MEIADVVKRAYAMPLTNPSFPPGPYRFFDREYVIITYRTTREALEAVVPAHSAVLKGTFKKEAKRNRRDQSDPYFAHYSYMSQLPKYWLMEGIFTSIAPALTYAILLTIDDADRKRGIRNLVNIMFVTSRTTGSSRCSSYTSRSC